MSGKSIVLVRIESAAHRDQDAAANHAWQIDSDGLFRVWQNGPEAVRPDAADLYWFEETSGQGGGRLLDPQIVGKVVSFLVTLRDLPPHTTRLDDRMEGGARIRATFLTPDGERVVEVDSTERGFLDQLLLPLLAALGGVS